MTELTTPTPTTDYLDDASGRALVEAWKASGLNGAAFCRQRNIRAQRLHYWRERLGYPIKVIGARQNPDCSPSTKEGFVQVVVGEQSPPITTSIAICVGGARIQVQTGFDADLLRSVVSALRGEP